MSKAEELLQDLRGLVSKIDGMADEIMHLANEIEDENQQTINYLNYSELIDMGEIVQETVTNLQEAQGWI